jgi:sulfate adenylyltransferase large subunit
MSSTTQSAAEFNHFVEQAVNKQLLRFFTAGSVDDGKSTLIGRLLYDSQAVYEDQLAEVRKNSGMEGAAAIDFAQLTDGLRAEREQGITIDVAYRFFSTAKRQFIIADTPGHEQYTRNMATGASTASLAVILIDARKGVLPQSRRHAFIASLLGVNHMVVAVNKMDLVDFSEERFEAIRDDFSNFVAPLQIKDICFVPISALHGDNIVHRSERMPWYTGPNLLGHLESVHIASDRNLAEMRFPVQYVIRTADGFRGYGGYLASGILRLGDKVEILPSRSTSYIKSLHAHGREVDEAVAPMVVTATLADDVDVSRGAMLVHPLHAPRVSHTVDIRIVWMSERTLDLDSSYLVKHTTQTVRAKVRHVRYRVNISTLEKEPAERLGLNDIGAVTLVCQRPLFCDAYKRNPATGSLILIDPITNETVGAGMITGVQAEGPQSTTDEASGEIAGEAVTREERIARRGHYPAVLWVGSNYHLQHELERLLFERGCLVHSIEERIAPEHAAQLVRILSAAGLISIWSSLALARTDLEDAAQAADGIAFVAADDAAEPGSETQASSVCKLLEDRGILLRTGRQP